MGGRAEHHSIQTEPPLSLSKNSDANNIGLDPNGHKDGMTAYYRVSDIKQSLQSLVEDGAQVLEAIKDVGSGRLIASAKDADGNIIGFVQDP